MRRHAKEYPAPRREPDGEIIDAWKRRCRWCGTWFWTPWYRDSFCCQGCEDTYKDRTKQNGQQKQKKTWPMARKVR